MTTLKQLLAGAAAAALVSGASLTATASLAQTQTDTQGTSQTDDQGASQTEGQAGGQPQTGQDSSQTGSQDAAQPGQSQAGEQAAPQAGGEGTAQSGDAAGGRLIATVNDAEIREGDVTQALQTLPPQAQQMPPQMLLPMVVEQLVLRELILARAEQEDLRSDPEVTAMVDPQNEALTEQAILSVWLQRALSERVTEEQITAAFDRFKEANPDTTVTLETARPQIQQGLTQEAMQQVATELRQGATVVFYDASGNPVPEGGSSQGGGSGAGAAGSDQPTDTGSGMGTTGSDQPADTGSGSGTAGSDQPTDTGSGTGQSTDTDSGDAAAPDN